MSETYILVIVFVIQLIFSWLLHKFYYIKSSKYTLKKANPTGIRWSTQSKPVSGGITFYTMFILSVIGYTIFYNEHVSENTYFFPIVLIVTISFFMGLADDIINTTPIFKFIVQVLSGIILISSGISIHLCQNEIINSIFTVIWIIGIMNSINMLDNMDAITTITSIFILAGIAFLSFYTNLDFARFFLMILLAVIASLISFLFFNWNPSKLYMGDNGSQFLGSFLAVMAVIFLWNISGSEVLATGKQFVVVFSAFIIPISDTFAVTINRLRKGKSPFVGGKDHTTHNLSYLGLNDKNIARLYALLTLLGVTSSVIMVVVIEKWSYLHTILFSIYPFIVLITLYIITLNKKKQNEDH
ncbi:MAG: hypothetical protein C0594_12385 [Marinilabiliales bacterium]|nr:MAG: hypothetical protein C0594_12385 [Marinilabiliales bacterium]